MKYTAQTLDNAIDYILPDIAKAKSMGVKFSRPDLLNNVAKYFFIKSFDREYDPSYSERIAIYICQEAMIDLNTDGYFTYGEMNFNFS